jgi:hypothetical protein
MREKDAAIVDTHISYDRVVVVAVWLILAHTFGINSVSDHCIFVGDSVLTMAPRCSVYF